jgi:hypothetical protein
MKERREHKAEKVGESHKTRFPVHPRNKHAFKKVPADEYPVKHGEPVKKRRANLIRCMAPVGWLNSLMELPINGFYTKKFKSSVSPFAAARAAKVRARNGGSASPYPRITHTVTG